jgi:aerobic-type carbon monoxide dehydrogenase small subunit (CoxS/CutS family)
MTKRAGPGPEPVRIVVNGRPRETVADPLTPLRTVLGEELDLRSVREPCGVGACGACTVLVGGQPVKSCLCPVGLVGDREVVTAEGLAIDDPVVGALASHNAFQCGYCVPGFVLAIHGLLAVDPAPRPEAIREALLGNLCRCGSYALILEAVAGLVARAPSPD